jgi:NADPH:quinone reductase-like Zn-dependent oxidoreductase
MDSGLNSLLHLPATPGYDVVGRIVSETETGDFKRGDRVAALLQTGGNARYAVVHTNSLVKVPPSVDSTDAACMASIYMTAYQAFKRAVAHITQNKERSGYDDYLLRNKKVLITGGMGPVSQALIELCQRTGGDVYCTAPKKSHSVLKRQMHVVNVLPPAPQDWLPLVKDQMDIVFDGQCQDGFESPHAALKQTDEKSVLICIGTHGLLNSEEANALCGTPLSAMWATTKASWFMDKTEFYNVWSSFQDNPDQYKVRNTKNDGD